MNLLTQSDKIFLTYIGSFLACSAVLVVIVKKIAEGFAVSGKKPVVSGGFSSVVVSGAAYLSSLVFEHLFSLYFVFAGIFLILGIIHMVFFHQKYFYSDNQNKNKVLFGEILFGIALIFFTIVVFSSLQHFLGNRNFLFFPMLMSTLAFFIPLSFYYTFRAAHNIPEPVFNTWEYPDTPIELPDESPNEKLVVIAFEICKKAAQKEKTNFRAKGPETMKLGDLYYHFINDYNEIQSETTIQYEDAGNHPHEWWFRVKPKWYQFQRILDPELTVRENGIKENTVIICDRLLKT